MVRRRWALLGGAPKRRLTLVVDSLAVVRYGKVAGRSHVDAVRPQDHQGAGALGLVRHDHRELPAPRLGLANDPKSRLAISPWGSEHEMKILSRIGIEQCLLEERDAGWEDHVPHHDETTIVGVLVVPNQPLAFVTPGVCGFVERGAVRHRRIRIGGPRMSKVDGLSPRAFRVSSRTRLAISILSRQSGSMVAGGCPSTGEPPTAS